MKKTINLLDAKAKNFATRCISQEEYESYSDSEDWPYIVTSNWIQLLSKKMVNFQEKYYIHAFSTYCKIIACEQDISTDQRFYCIEMNNGKEIVTRNFDSSILTSLGAQKLLKFGCIYQECDDKHLVSYLCISASHAPLHTVYSSLGWYFNNDEPVFLSNRAFSKNGDFDSNYIGEISIQPTGSLDAWMKMIETEVLGNTALTFGLLLGFSSMLLSYLNRHLDLGNLWFNFSGNSSKGKTTVAMLAASVFSKPIFNQGLITSFNGTANAMLTFVAKANAHTVVIDEIATGARQDFRKFAYQICSGVERRRLNPNGEEKEYKTFSSIILSTAEFPVIDDTAPDGIKARVFEIESALTSSAENSDRIKRTVYENYGVAGEKFAEFVIQNKLDSILSDYYEAVDILKDFFKGKGYEKHALSDRILSKLAVILQTANYVEECFQLELKTDALLEYILNLERSVVSEANIEDKAFDCIMQYVSRHRNKFATDFEPSDFPIEGRIDNRGTKQEILILKEVVEEILSKNGFENRKIIFKKWAEAGRIYVEKDRNYKRLALRKGEKPLPCFHFKNNF